MSQVQYLGYIIDERGVHVDPIKIQVSSVPPSNHLLQLCLEFLLQCHHQLTWSGHMSSGNAPACFIGSIHRLRCGMSLPPPWRSNRPQIFTNYGLISCRFCFPMGCDLSHPISIPQIQRCSLFSRGLLARLLAHDEQWFSLSFTYHASIVEWDHSAFIQNCLPFEGTQTISRVRVPPLAFSPSTFYPRFSGSPCDQVLRAFPF